jgi:hypothetical protein
MRTTGKTVDRILLALVGWRLGQGEDRGDAADRFADRLVALLGAEMERRNRCLDEDDLSRHRERHKKLKGRDQK